VVITTAQVPGRKPPQLVSADAVTAMRPGSVVVDLASSSYGGNVAVSEPERTVVVGGVTVIGAGNLPSEMAPAASTAYAKNMVALLGLLVKDGALAIDRGDDVQAGIVVTHDGAVVSDTVSALLEKKVP
jgi:H+-translocating NAD(P) transhydrogenase subunit alpha